LPHLQHRQTAVTDQRTQRLVGPSGKREPRTCRPIRQVCVESGGAAGACRDLGQIRFSGQRPPRRVGPHQPHPISNFKLPLPPPPALSPCSPSSSPSHRSLYALAEGPGPGPRGARGAAMTEPRRMSFRDGRLASRKAEEAGTDLTHLPSLALSRPSIGLSQGLLGFDRCFCSGFRWGFPPRSSVFCGNLGAVFADNRVASHLDHLEGVLQSYDDLKDALMCRWYDS
jgi:hypothetical protein